MNDTRDVKAPNLENVLVADITVAYNGEDIPKEVTVVIDNELAYRIANLTDTHDEWADWDLEFFYYLTKDEWQDLISIGYVNDQWYLVQD
jgi:hypothetical protein